MTTTSSGWVKAETADAVVRNGGRVRLLSNGLVYYKNAGRLGYIDIAWNGAARVSSFDTLTELDRKGRFVVVEPPRVRHVPLRTGGVLR